MADPLGSTASILTLLDVCVKVIEYIQEVKDGSSERTRLMMEISSIKGILESLIATVENAKLAPEAWSETIRSINRKGGPLDLLQELLIALHDELRRVVSAKCVGRMSRSLLWPFKKKEIEERLKVIDRQKLLLTLALDNDHVALSREIRSDVLTIRNDVAVIRADIEQRKDDENRLAILDWLTQVDYAPQQDRFIGERQLGTVQWLLDSEEFLKWQKTKSQTMFCHGMPGAGKTFATSIVVDYLRHKQNGVDQNGEIGIAFVYCEFKRQHEQKPEHILRTVLKQLVRHQLSMPRSVQRFYDHNKQASPSLPSAEISKVLHSVVLDYSQVFIIIDALDECQDPETLIKDIFGLQAHTEANLFITSRPIPRILNKFKGSLSLEISARGEDVERYLDGNMSLVRLLEDDGDESEDEDLSEEIKAQIKTETKTKITKAANGVWVCSYAID